MPAGTGDEAMTSQQHPARATVAGPADTGTTQDHQRADPPPAGRQGSRHRTTPVLLVVLLLVAGLVTAGVVVAGRDDPAPGAGRSAEAPSGRDSAVRAVLDRRAQAVLGRDREAFLADINRGDPDFVAEQEQLFDNLTKVDFASWHYELVGDDYNRPDLAKTYDRPYHLPAVLLHYAIKGFDRAPVARPQVLTFVKTGKRWLIASDSDADRQLPATGHADPWDRRPIVVGRGRSVLVLADATDEARLDRLVRVGDQAVRRVADFWSDGWRRRVVVVAVQDQHLIETYFRTPGRTSDDVAAIAVPAYDTVPGWSTDGGEDEPLVARSRVILNPRYFDPSDRDNVDLLAHEVTHVATQQRTMPGTPRWLAEGAAEYTAYRYLEPFSIRLPRSLQRQVAAGSVDLPTYDFYQRDVAAHYIAGFLACAYIADEYGDGALRRVYRLLGRNVREALVPQAQDRVFQQVLGVSTDELRRGLADYAGRLAR